MKTAQARIALFYTKHFFHNCAENKTTRKLLVNVNHV